MDLNKEIKLSDLVRRPKKKKTPGVVKPSNGKRKRRRKQEIVGLKIGASQIAASRVVNNGSAKLVQLARVPLAPGVVVGGEVRDVAALAKALDRFFSDNKLPRRGIRLGIGTNRIGVRTVDIEGVDDERQLGNVVRFRAHEALSIPLDQAVLDYHVVSETVDESGAVSRRVLLAAAYKEPIDHYVEACRAAGLELSGIDVEAFALLRAVAPRNGNGDARRSPRSSSRSVTTARRWRSPTEPSATSCAFSTGAARSSRLRSRRSSGSPGPRPPSSSSSSISEAMRRTHDPRAPFARAAVERELQTLARELVASLHFYQGQPGSLAISEVIVTGGTTRIPGLAEELERLTRVPVRIADPLAGVQVSNGLAERDDLASLAAAIGLGVEG